MKDIDLLFRDLSSLTFGNPEAGYLFLILPLILLFFWYSWFREQRFLKALRQDRRKSGKRYIAASVLWCIMAGSLVGVAMQPQVVDRIPNSAPSARQCILLIDTSESMAAWDEDMQMPNIRVAADTAWEVLKGISPARCQIFAYAGAFLDISEFTSDYRHLYDTLQSSLYTDEPQGTIPVSGSDLPNALSRLANWLDFPEYENVSNIILISDGNIGSDQGVSLENAIAKFRDNNWGIVTVGIGSKEGQRIHLLNAKGEFQGYEMQGTPQGTVPRVFYLEEENLKRIASMTGERYFHYSQTDELVEYLLETQPAVNTSSEEGEVLGQEDYSWVFMSLFTLSFAILLWRRRELY